METISEVEAQNYLENVMIKLSPELAGGNHGLYMAGVIDTLFGLGRITTEVRDSLYCEYGV